MINISDLEPLVSACSSGWYGFGASRFNAQELGGLTALLDPGSRLFESKENCDPHWKPASQTIRCITRDDEAAFPGRHPYAPGNVSFKNGRCMKWNAKSNNVEVPGDEE